SQAIYGCAAAAAAADPGPVHCSPVNVPMIDSQEVAVVLNSAARLLHVVAAAMRGPAPAPAYISAELISGGKAAKSKTISYPVPLSEFRYLTVLTAPAPGAQTAVNLGMTIGLTP